TRCHPSAERVPCTGKRGPRIHRQLSVRMRAAGIGVDGREELAGGRLTNGVRPRLHEVDLVPRLGCTERTLEPEGGAEPVARLVADARLEEPALERPGGRDHAAR